MHHDHDFAVNRNGTQDIFLNTPNQAAWFERYVTDWTGPKGRLGRMKFRMKGSVFPGDTMVMRAKVESRRDRRRRLRLGVTARLALGRRRAEDRLLRARRAADQRRTTTPGPAAATTGARDLHSDQEEEVLMDLEFTEEQEMLREMVRGVCTSYASLETVREVEDDPVGYPLELWKQLGALDLIGLMIPAEYGGSEMSLLDGAVVYEELGRALAPSPHFVSAVMSAGVLQRTGTERAEAGVAAEDRDGRGDPHDRRGSSRTTASGRRACRSPRPPTATGSCSTA